MHSGVLKELADYKAILGNLWKVIVNVDVPEVWKRASIIKEITSIIKDRNEDSSGNLMLVSLTSIPVKVMEQIVLKAFSKHIYYKVIEIVKWGYEEQIMLDQSHSFL